VRQNKAVCTLVLGIKVGSAWVRQTEVGSTWVGSAWVK
jgi:hypothetical protein